MTELRFDLDKTKLAPNQHLTDGDRAHAEILGYERFLRVSGHHLNLLAQLSQTDSAAWRTLSDRLARLPVWETSQGCSWLDAASQLGTAHDLVASHIGPDLALRTPEIEELAGGPELIAAARAMLGRLEAAARTGDELLDRTGRGQRRAEHHLTTAHHYAVLRSASDAIAVYGRAALWDLREASYPTPVDRFQMLAAAPLAEFRHSPEFDDSLQALRLLRRLVRAQAHGEVPASPISLRDLALLGAAVTDPEQLAEPKATASPVQLLEHAHLQDQLDFAHQSWEQLAEHLLTHTQGLTKAPREYAVALDQLNRPLDPALRIAIARTLPDLGRRAGDVIRQLAFQNALVSHQREPGTLQTHWRPLSAAHREALADLFADAGVASAAVAELGLPAEPQEKLEAKTSTTRRLTRSQSFPSSATP